MVRLSRSTATPRTKICPDLFPDLDPKRRLRRCVIRLARRAKGTYATRQNADASSIHRKVVPGMMMADIGPAPARRYSLDVAPISAVGGRRHAALDALAPTTSLCKDVIAVSRCDCKSAMSNIRTCRQAGFRSGGKNALQSSHVFRHRHPVFPLAERRRALRNRPPCMFALRLRQE